MWDLVDHNPVVEIEIRGSELSLPILQTFPMLPIKHLNSPSNQYSPEKPENIETVGLYAYATNRISLFEFNASSKSLRLTSKVLTNSATIVKKYHEENDVQRAKFSNVHISGKNRKTGLPAVAYPRPFFDNLMSLRRHRCMSQADE